MNTRTEMASRLGGVLVMLERLEGDAEAWGFEEGLDGAAVAEHFRLALDHLALLRNYFAKEACDGAH